MRIRTLALIGALLTACPAIAGGQQEPAAAAGPAAAAPAQVPPPSVAPPLDVTVGRADFGFRGESVSGDSARYNRYRDLREGAVFDRFRLERQTEAWAFVGTANNVGYRDQRFAGEFNSIGRVKLGFTWDQIPLFISRETQSLQPATGTGVLNVDDAIQLGIERGALSLSNAMTSTTRFDMRSRRDVAAFDLTYTANRDVDFVLEVTNTHREGPHLQSFSVGSSPGNGIAQELGIPTDTRTTDVKAAVEFANARGMASAGVNASWFDNRIPTVQFDNPLRFTDISGGPSKGLAVMWPSNSLVSFVANGAYRFPAKTRATAAISIGRADQNEALPPPTINTALVAPPLERATAEARADVISMVYNLNSRPWENIWLNARYRYYDYANQTPLFETTALVGDWAASTTHWETEPLSVTRHTLDFDASFTPYKYVAFSTGYSREAYDRTYRIFERTAEDIVRASIDSTGNAYVTVRLKYEYSRREGSGFEQHLLEEVDEQPTMRHYDVADRNRSRVTGLLTLTPVSWLNINGSAGTGHDDYRNTGFGLRDNRNNTYSVGFELMPVATVNFGVSYEREKYTANQYSRTANPPPNPQFDDPTRDWWIDSNDTVRTVGATADFLKTIPRTDVRLSYDLTDGKATYVYDLAPGSTVFVPPASLQQLQPLTNRITDARADVQYFVRANIALGAVYWYEAYRVFDFSLNPTTINTLNIGTSTIYSGYLYQPYTAHTAWLKVSYLW
jgi:MtrB/PioB family decaheme-associated outer membrane protein